MSEENTENIIKSDSNFASTFFNLYVLPDINFNGCYLMNNSISTLENVISLYISYILNP